MPNQEFTQICLDILAMFENVKTINNNTNLTKQQIDQLDTKIVSINTLLDSLKQDFETKKGSFDKDYTDYLAKSLKNEEIQSSIADMQKALIILQGLVSADKDTIVSNKALFDNAKADFETKYADFLTKFAKALELSQNIENVEALIEELQSIIDNGVIDDVNLSDKKTYSSQKITELNNTLNQTVEATKTALEQSISTFALKSELTTKSEELSSALQSGLNTKLNNSNVVNSLGADESLVLSQKAITEALNLKSNITDLKPANTLLATMGTPIGVTTLGTQFYCLANQNQYILTDNSEVTTETTLQSLIDSGKVVNITPLGVGQTWQDVTSQREANKNYVNTTDRAITVIIYIHSGYGTTSNVYLDDKPVAGIVGETARGFGGNAFLIVQPLSKYKCDSSARAWYELR
ncbi:hypothetical protein CIG2463D_1366 [Campylobacter iguaniorum]|uniref:hypothetical protein n=1 Tax=Campylobacter iguaniorum TaxID=1244531 RepID=UPI00073A4B8D|nr:hypothetical protein [Campylobacter iguaniorum]ALV24934.1 hypothetical protein CIG2463D_1366 [Campylobacter iguaniorum]